MAEDMKDQAFKCCLAVLEILHCGSQFQSDAQFGVQAEISRCFFAPNFSADSCFEPTPFQYCSCGRF